jgi:aminoglycoside 3-N-acetyltransferase
MMKLLSSELSYLEIAENLNLEEVDTLFIASDIKGLTLDCKKKNLRFDPHLFIESFQNVLPKGNLIFPAYTDNLKSGDTFHYEKSKPTTGALSKRVQGRKDFKRSMDPLHSVFAWGVDQDKIIQLDDKSTFGESSIFNFLEQKQAKMLIIDVPFQNSFTYVHFIEERIPVSYRGYQKLNFWIDKDGEKTSKLCFFHTKKRGVLTDLEQFEKDMIEKGIVEVFQFNTVQMKFMDLRKMSTEIVDYLNKGGKLHRFDLLTYLKSFAKTILRR